MRTRVGSMARCGDMAEHFERIGAVAFDVCNCHKKDHYCVGWFVGIGSRGATNDALEVGTFKIPASAVGGPDLSLN